MLPARNRPLVPPSGWSTGRPVDWSTGGPYGTPHGSATAVLASTGLRMSRQNGAGYPRSTEPAHPRSQRGRGRADGRGAVDDQEDLYEARALRGTDVLHQLPGPDGDLLRRPERDEQGPRPLRRAVRVRIGRVLHR